MKEPNSAKAQKIKDLEEKVEILGTALTNMYQDMEYLKGWSTGVSNVLDKMPEFKKAYEEAVKEDEISKLDLGEDGN